MATFLAVLANSVEIRIPEYEAFISRNIQDRPVAIMMHVGWCGACQRTLPYFRTASEILVSNAALADIDVTDDRDFVDSVGLKGYPGLRVLPKGSDPSTPYSDWLPIPYYTRDTIGIVNFLERVAGPDYFTNTDVIDYPSFGHVRSLVVGGDLSLLTNIKTLKTKFQIVHSDALCPTKNSDQICVSVVPLQSVLFLALSERPWFLSSDSTQVSAWIDQNGFPGLWLIQDSRFQWFNDQPVWKVLVAQDPASVDSKDTNMTIARQVAQCVDKLPGTVSFGVISGVAFKDALQEFQIETLPAVLMLSNSRLDYDKFFNDLSLSTICEDVEAALNGNKELKFRGGLGSKIRFMWSSTLRTLGLESDIAKAGALLGTVLMVTILAGYCVTACWPENDDELDRKKRESLRNDKITSVTMEEPETSKPVSEKKKD